MYSLIPNKSVFHSATRLKFYWKDEGHISAQSKSVNAQPKQEEALFSSVTISKKWRNNYGNSKLQKEKKTLVEKEKKIKRQSDRN